MGISFINDLRIMVEMAHEAKRGDNGTCLMVAIFLKTHYQVNFGIKLEDALAEPDVEKVYQLSLKRIIEERRRKGVDKVGTK